MVKLQLTLKHWLYTNQKFKVSFMKNEIAKYFAKCHSFFKIFHFTHLADFSH